MPQQSSALTVAQLALLFKQLQQLDAAGLPAFEAFAALAKLSPELKNEFSILQRQLKSGQAISMAGYRAGIFDETLKSILEAAESAGRLATVYHQLADYYASSAARSGRLKSRLMFPAAVFIISIFVQPLPDLAAAHIGVSTYLQMTVGRLFVLAAMIYFLLRLPLILRSVGAGNLLLHLPVIGRRIIDRQLNNFFFILAMLLEGGVAFAEALPKAVKAIGNTAVQAHFSVALSKLGSGASVTNTLADVTIIKSTILGVLDSSEQSGKLASGMLHHTRLDTEGLNREDDEWAAWLPRIIYALIAGSIAYSILSGPMGTGAVPIP
jgi:general secretion pathway protein F